MHSALSCLISNGEAKGIRPLFSASHVVPSDPTSARGHEARAKTERRWAKNKQPANGWRWREKGGMETGIKRGQMKKMGERIKAEKNTGAKMKDEQRGGRDLLSRTG